MKNTIEECLTELRGLSPAVVSTELADREAHAVDAWPVSVKRVQQGVAMPLPSVVVRPRDAQQVSQILRIANARGVSVTPWGAGSSVVGQPLPEEGGISLDMRAMSRIIDVDDVNLQIRVEAGAMGSVVEEHLVSLGYTMNFSPQSLARSTVGGWVATRATGQFSSRWGGIEDALVSLTVVRPTGEIVSTHGAPRAATGPDIKQLFVGSEGTLGVVTEVVLKIYPVSPFENLDTLVFPDARAGLEAMRKIMRAGLRPMLLRVYDQEEARHALKDPTFAGAAMFLGVRGVQAVAEAELAACVSIATDEGGASQGPAGAEAWMGRRFDFSAVEAILDEPGGVAETIEVSNTWSGIAETYAQVKKALEPLVDEVLCHFSHAYSNGTSLYVIVLGKQADAAAAEARLHQIWETTMETCLATDASLSHHHGSGLARLPWLAESLGDSLAIVRDIKQALDPGTVLSPGRLAISSQSGAR
ncbi:MAG: FAD-binding oxidoreductase [Microcella sp.]|uniref:FAD-binding oxidoreductase n=1 Tax=Microcella sp. TaxID=1913979 RepID=UPI0033164751